MVVFMQTPTTIVTGFLGSGKTTIISHLIEYLQNRGEKIAYVKNEIGEEDLDAKLMQGKNIRAKEVLGGCICCTLVGPFIASINELLDSYAPDRIIIESAGTAEPASLALMVENHNRLSRDGLIAIIDVLNFTGYKDLHDAAKRQAEMTDLIVLNKVELASLEEKQRVVGYIRELNEYSPIIEAPKGKVSPEAVFGVAQKELAELSIQHDEHQHHSHHEAEDNITAFTFVSNRVFDKTKLEEAINKLPKTVFRVKGLVQLETGPEILNAAYKRVIFSPVPEGVVSEETRLIVIGYKVKQDREVISQSLAI